MKKINLTAVLVLIAGIMLSAKAQGVSNKTEKVKFNSAGIELVGNLYFPTNYKIDKKYPAIIIVGPATSVKEQVAGTYAEEMAKRGYVTLAFDHTGYGKSAGENRTMEDIFIKSEDIMSAVSFMRSLEQVDETKVGAIGICAGAGYLVETAVGEKRLAAIATISGTLQYQGIVTVSGGEKLLTQASVARQKHDEAGEITYIPIIDKPTDNSNTFASEAYNYYVGNQDKYPTWKNQIAISSFSNLAALNIKEVVSSVKQPILFVAGSKAVTAQLSQIAFENANNAKTKELYIVNGATHMSLYENIGQINETCNEIDEFFKKRLKLKSQKFIKNLLTNMVGLTYETQQQQQQQKAPNEVKLGTTNKEGVTIRKVSFLSHGTKIIGNLHIPVNYNEGNKLPAIVVVGPATSVKEQVGGDYAFLLAKKGFVTLAFDHRTFGESDGFPRCTEDIIIKSEDIKSAVSYICSLKEVDNNRIGAIGICAGGGFLVETAPGEKRINAVATISGTLSAKKVVEDMPGSDIILSMSNDAKQKYDLYGEATYMRLFAEKRPKKSKKKIDKFQQEAFDYYVSNSDKHPLWRADVYLGAFSNIASFDIPTAVEAITVPKLFIAGTEAYTAPLSQNAYDVSIGDKELFWINEATHVSLYYNKKYMDKVTEKLNIFFNKKLK